MPESKSDSALKYAERIAYSSKEVLRFTYDMAVKYKDSPGVYCEAGVAAGAQIIAMAAGAPNKTIYAFDSFEGIPLPSNKDNQMPGIRMLSKEEQNKLPNPGEQVLESSGATVVSLEDFINHINSAIPIDYSAGGTGYFGQKFYSLNLENNCTIVICGGWFEHVLPNWSEVNSKTQIAILRLDGDLYNSTYVCLKYLYPKVIKAGLVIIDDWALPGCRQAVMDYFTMRPEFQDMQIQDSEHLCKRLDMKFIKDENSTVAYWTR